MEKIGPKRYKTREEEEGHSRFWFWFPSQVGSQEFSHTSSPAALKELLALPLHMEAGYYTHCPLHSRNLYLFSHFHSLLGPQPRQEYPNSTPSQTQMQIEDSAELLVAVDGQVWKRFSGLCLPVIRTRLRPFPRCCVGAVRRLWCGQCGSCLCVFVPGRGKGEQGRCFVRV